MPDTTNKPVTKLHGLIAVLEKIKAAALGNFGESTKTFNHPVDHFEGNLIITTAKEDARKALYDARQEKRIQTSVIARIKYTFALMKNWWDVQWQIDKSNVSASADIIIGEEVLAANVPVHHLLWLEKQIVVWMEFIQGASTLPTGVDWELDATFGAFIYKTTKELERDRREKVPYPFVLAAATEKHPAQVIEKVMEVVVADIRETKWDGRLPSVRKAEVKTRMQTLLSAVQQARQRANDIAADNTIISEKLLAYVFATLEKPLSE